MRGLIIALLVVGVLLGGVAVFIAVDSRGDPEQAGTITASKRAGVAEAEGRQRSARETVDAPATKQILFGDVHAHTTFSMDAFAWSLPVLGGDGVHPPADACDYARFVAQLDFWAHTDHAESLTPRHWDLIRETVRACNAAAGDPANPDLVTFLGWEWTQMGNTPETHYGHRNVFLLHDDEDRTPTRPIAASGVAFNAMRQDSLSLLDKYIGPYLVSPGSRQRQFDQRRKSAELRAVALCEEGVPVRELPHDCAELASTPGELLAKLADWDFPVQVVPHGTSWGFYTPPAYDWDKQITPEHADAERQTLIEVYSGHGNAEPYRDWRAATRDADGALVCPEATDDYLPSCRRAGQIVRSRCDDPASEACEAEVRLAQQRYLQAGRAGHLVVPGVEVADWLDAGQCRDCFQPPLNHRPGGSVQYILAKRNFTASDGDGDPFGMRFGFIGSSDDHNARPGHGFKEVDRQSVTDTYGAHNPLAQKVFVDAARTDEAEGGSRAFDPGNAAYNFLQVNESERQASFFYTGGLMAVHSAGRGREAIWEAIERREVYATSGPRILLWFDLVADGARRPMGSILRHAEVPEFEVRAMGAFEQRDGCPEDVIDRVGAERLQKLSGGECYHPGDKRHPITAIEVVRIRPQTEPDEPVGELIEDPWKVLDCPGDGTGCTARFSDPEYADAGRETIYYVRALQAEQPTINADNLRCETNADGECVAVNPCYGDPRTPSEDDCLAPAAQRAWSSPIYLRPGS